MRQCQDGSWEPGWMYRYGSTGVKIGNRGLTTALAVKAISSSINVSMGRPNQEKTGNERASL